MLNAREREYDRGHGIAARREHQKATNRGPELPCALNLCRRGLSPGRMHD